MAPSQKIPGTCRLGLKHGRVSKEGLNITLKPKKSHPWSLGCLRDISNMSHHTALCRDFIGQFVRRGAIWPPRMVNRVKHSFFLIKNLSAHMALKVFLISPINWTQKFLCRFFLLLLCTNQMQPIKISIISITAIEVFMQTI